MNDAIKLLRDYYDLQSSDFVTDQELDEWLKSGLAFAAARLEDKLGIGARAKLEK